MRRGPQPAVAGASVASGWLAGTGPLGSGALGSGHWAPDCRSRWGASVASAAGNPALAARGGSLGLGGGGLRAVGRSGRWLHQCWLHRCWAGVGSVSGAAGCGASWLSRCPGAGLTGRRLLGPRGRAGLPGGGAALDAAVDTAPTETVPTAQCPAETRDVLPETVLAEPVPPPSPGGRRAGRCRAGRCRADRDGTGSDRTAAGRQGTAGHSPGGDGPPETVRLPAFVSGALALPAGASLVAGDRGSRSSCRAAGRRTAGHGEP